MPMKLKFLSLGLLILLLGLPGGCAQDLSQPKLDGAIPLVRVLLLDDVEQVTLRATHPPTVVASSDGIKRRLNVSSGTPVRIVLAGQTWKIGNAEAGQGELTIIPAYDGTVSINNKAYRGQYRLVPQGKGRFDLVNDVDIDSYLKSVISKELYTHWDIETYRAQAIVARTYALYEARTSSVASHFDLFDDQRSQVYGGIQAETPKSQAAVDHTAGIVLAYGPRGHERIFKAYFSSTCGGISQSAADAFGDQWSEPLSDHVDQGLCSAAPRFNWGPITISRKELTRRIRLWGERRQNPVARVGTIARIDSEPNRWGRPVRFYLTDDRGIRYMLRSEELRHAVNTDAADDKTRLPSSFVKVIVDDQNVHFVEGHGHGHGVGMCQWAAQRRAEMGMPHEDIALSAYPGAILVRAY